MYPIVLNDEFIGYIPFRGQEASFYNAEIPLEDQKPVSISRVCSSDKLHSYYLAEGDRAAVLKVIWDLGYINPEQKEEIRNFSDVMLDQKLDEA